MLKLKSIYALAPLCALTLMGAVTATAQEQSNSESGITETHGVPFWLQTPTYENEDQEIADSYRPDWGMQRFDAFGVPRTTEFEQPDVVEVDTGAPAIVPEPGTMVLLVGGLAMLAVRRVRRSNTA